MIKITKSIAKNESLSEDKIIQILNLYFTNKYKTDWISKVKCRLKKIYSFESNGWETIQKKLTPIDSGIITINENSIKFELILMKQFLISVLGGILLTLILWKGYNINFSISVLIITIIEIIIWAAIIRIGNEFLKKSLIKIEKTINE
ncbi:hypothetical protein SAMN05216503_2115 [Polaribacter sp. KT25b]|uniref:hypothetical protein n=1 Tax=Polaribacter sp. KT25b TaxID=1855336 RepID=UPI0008799584|nr:hypothetical protein [Polaribacter sp. KT25b]SDS14518.1 hypothetical protein SAMN05216503_2115 [Polaribacter sp. KT25b]